jgi:hypothetical protein
LITTQRIQFSSHLRAVIHCATRLQAKSEESTYGLGLSVQVRWIQMVSAEAAIPEEMPASHAQRGVRVTGSSVRCSPPCSHSYHPYAISAKQTTCSSASAYNFAE